MEEKLRNLKEILDIYPDYFNVTLPHSVVCPAQDGAELALPFKRSLPKFFKVNNVELCKKTDGCVWRVCYSLKDGSNFPTGPDLKVLVSYLTKYKPGNTVIMDKALYLPNIVEISYAVVCNCPRLYFEAPADPAQMQHVKDEFQQLKI